MHSHFVPYYTSFASFSYLFYVFILYHFYFINFICYCFYFFIFFSTVERYLRQVLNFQNIVVCISSQHSPSLTGHIYIIIFYRLAADRHPPAQNLMQSRYRISRAVVHMYYKRFLDYIQMNKHHLRGFPEEVVLAKYGDEEANKAFYCHRNKSSSHNVPLKW